MGSRGAVEPLRLAPVFLERDYGSVLESQVVRLLAAHRSVLFAGCLNARRHGPGRDRDSRILTWYATRRSGSDGPEEHDQELGVFTPRTQVPRGQEQLGRQPDFAGVGQE
jgi:hypothetical protein